MTTPASERAAVSPDALTFVCCIEGTPIEPQALLLCESIRRFAGPYAGSPIVAVNPRPDKRITAASERRLEQLGVQYVSERLNDTGSPYLPINRIAAAAWAESHLDTPYVVVLDSDTLFVRAPSFRHADVGVRPVDMKGSASAGPDDPLDAYWSSMCDIAGIPLEALPYVTASIEGCRVRASYNGGFCIARRALGVFAKTHRVFEASRLRDMRPLRDRGFSVFASTGAVGPDASEWWGSSQAALSVAIHARTRDVLVYDDRYNVPVHLIAEPGAGAGTGWPKADLILLHYHWLFGTGYRAELMRRACVLGAGEHVLEWLREVGEVRARDAVGAYPSKIVLSTSTSSK
jgi:hypothetical protein